MILNAKNFLHDAPAAAQQQPTINIVNTNANTNSNTNVNNNANGPATGIIWLFTCGLFGIGWLVDLVMILLGAFRDNMGQPLV